MDVEPIERLRVKFEMAVRLLSANYDLKPEDFSELIVLEPDDPGSDERGSSSRGRSWASPQNLRPLPETVCSDSGRDGRNRLEDAIGIASFHVATGRVPAASAWVDGLAQVLADERTEAFAESFF